MSVGLVIFYYTIKTKLTRIPEIAIIIEMQKNKQLEISKTGIKILLLILRPFVFIIIELNALRTSHALYTCIDS